MSRSSKGIRRLLCVRFLVLEGKLPNWLSDQKPHKLQINIPPK
jgi:hypothetical protein